MVHISLLKVHTTRRQLQAEGARGNPGLRVRGAEGRGSLSAGSMWVLEIGCGLPQMGASISVRFPEKKKKKKTCQKWVASTKRHAHASFQGGRTFARSAFRFHRVSLRAAHVTFLRGTTSKWSVGIHEFPPKSCPRVRDP